MSRHFVGKHEAGSISSEPPAGTWTANGARDAWCSPPYVRGGAVVPECELRGEVQVPILAEHADVLREEPGDARPELEADRRIAVARLPRIEVEAVVRVRHEERRADPEIRLKPAVRELRALQERGAQQGVESD